MVEEFKLSDKNTVYRTRYNEGYSKENFIKRVTQNASLRNTKTYKSVESRVFISCKEFDSVDKRVVDVLGGTVDRVAKLSWVYTQKKDFNMIMHKHDYLYYTTEKTSLKTEWTCVFYIQIPRNLTKGEGDITFMTEDRKLHTFSPKENDILIFPGTLYHMVTPIPNAEIDRVIYASNFNLSI